MASASPVRAHSTSMRHPTTLASGVAYMASRSADMPESTETIGLKQSCSVGLRVAASNSATTVEVGLGQRRRSGAAPGQRLEGVNRSRDAPQGGAGDATRESIEHRRCEVTPYQQGIAGDVERVVGARDVDERR